MLSGLQGIKLHIQQKLIKKETEQMLTNEIERGEEEMNRQSTEDLQGSENTLHDTKMMDT